MLSVSRAPDEAPARRSGEGWSDGMREGRAEGGRGGGRREVSDIYLHKLKGMGCVKQFLHIAQATQGGIAVVST